MIDVCDNLNVVLWHGRSQFPNPLTDFSDSEIVEEEEYTSVLQNQEPRRSSLEENFGKTVAPADKKMLYRRSHSLAEIRPTHVFLPEGNKQITLLDLRLTFKIKRRSSKTVSCCRINQIRYCKKLENLMPAPMASCDIILLFLARYFYYKR